VPAQVENRATFTPQSPGAAFRSILFDESNAWTEGEEPQAPDFFCDLNLDQIVDVIASGREDYNLKPFFYVPLKRIEAIRYRQEVFRDLESPAVLHSLQSFAESMRAMRNHLARAEKHYYKYQKQAAFLGAVETYCGAVSHLAGELEGLQLNSRGLAALREFLTSYTSSGDFQTLVEDTRKLGTDLHRVTYSLRIAGNRVTVAKYGAEPDLSAEVLRTFEKFRQGEAKEYRFESPWSEEMNHVEAAIVDLVARLYPEIFAFLDEYCGRYSDCLNGTIARLDREAQFYLAVLAHIERFRQAGLPFCYPQVTDRSGEVYGNEVFDLGLANAMAAARTPVVTNSFHLKTPERIIVVSGPNQGGKTTFARAFGQLHYLACLGCPVPGKDARLFLFDRLFTHFERKEDLRNLSGKLEDELLRIHRILEEATPQSILIMNESFLSTPLSDALFLSRQVLRRVIDLKMLCVTVTFLDELASFDESTVSMVGTVDPRDPARRTFKIVRKAADGLAYAAAIAEKYRLTHDAVRARVAANAKEATHS